MRQDYNYWLQKKKAKQTQAEKTWNQNQSNKKTDTLNKPNDVETLQIKYNFVTSKIEKFVVAHS